MATNANDIPLGNQATITMIQYLTQSHYYDTELANSCSVLLMLHTRLGSYKYQFYKSFIWLDLEQKLWISYTLNLDLLFGHKRPVPCSEKISIWLVSSVGGSHYRNPKYTQDLEATIHFRSVWHQLPVRDYQSNLSHTFLHSVIIVPMEYDSYWWSGSGNSGLDYPGA